MTAKIHGTGGWKTQRSDEWIIRFTAVAYAFQIGLFLLGDTALRLPLRTGVFAVSLALLFLINGRGTLHPAARFIPAISILLFINMLNPTGGGIIAGAAQVLLYVAVLSPFIWVARIGVDRATLRKVMFIMWMFYSISAGMGALQTQYPGKFDGAISIQMTEEQASALTIVTADGTRIYRPKGLSDLPGGAGEGGVYSIILGVGLLLTERRLIVRGLVIVSSVTSMYCIYMVYGRTHLVDLSVAILALLAVLARRKMTRELLLLAGAGVLIVIVGTSLAFSVGGQATVDRWTFRPSEDGSALTREGEYNNLLSNEIFPYFFGAGGGRCGMMSVYFGDPSKMLGAEAMLETLLFDGGVPLIVCYLLFIFCILWTAWTIAIHAPDSELGCLAGVIFGVSCSTLSASVVFPIYIKEMALEVFMLNALLFGVSRGARKLDGVGKASAKAIFRERAGRECLAI